MGKRLLIILFLGTMFVSACGNVQKNGDDFKQVENKKITTSVEAEHRADILTKLKELKNVSEENYLLAEANTRMVELRGREMALLKKYRLQLYQEAEEMIAAKKRVLEEEYQLKMFNLRMQLESLKLRSKNRELLESKIEDLRSEREAKLSLLNAEKQEFINQKIGEYKLAMQQRLNVEFANLP